MTETENTKLKPCPFCGGEAEYLNNNKFNMLCVVMCKRCGAIIAKVKKHTAIEAWNKRSDETNGKQKT